MGSIRFEMVNAMRYEALMKSLMLEMHNLS